MSPEYTIDPLHVTISIIPPLSHHHSQPHFTSKPQAHKILQRQNVDHKSSYQVIACTLRIIPYKRETQFRASMVSRTNQTVMHATRELIRFRTFSMALGELVCAFGCLVVKRRSGTAIMGYGVRCFWMGD